MSSYLKQLFSHIVSTTSRAESDRTPPKIEFARVFRASMLLQFLFAGKSCVYLTAAYHFFPPIVLTSASTHRTMYFVLHLTLGYFLLLDRA